MSLIVSTNLEVLKEVDLKSRTFKNVFLGKSMSSKSAKDKDGICSMCWRNANEETIIYATSSRRIKEYQSGNVKELLQCSPESEKVKPIGLCCVEEKSLVVGLDDGNVLITNEDAVKTSWQTGGKLSVVRHTSARPNHLLSGGRENEVKLWDLTRAGQEDLQPIFVAKNVRPDELCLRRPVWVTDARFHHDGRRVVVATGHGEVRLYDPSTPQRRPVMDWRWGDFPVSCLALHPSRHDLVYAGNSMGDAIALELGRRGMLAGKFKKIGGAVRALSCCTSGRQPLLFSISSDRFLRAHDLDNRSVVADVYLKLRPTAMLVGERPATAEETDVWQVLDTVRDVKRKRKLKE